MSAAPTDYRNSHQITAAVRHYDEVLYRPGSRDSRIWKHEQAFLDEVAAGVLARAECHYLDAACGTGRVIGYLASRSTTALGVDVSSAMIEVAQTRVPQASFTCADVTSLNTNRQFDLITAFRLFLNADRSLQRGAARWLADALRPGGICIVNTHGNTWSTRTPSAVFRRYVLRQPVRWLSWRQLRRLFEVNGLVFLDRAGFGFFPERIESVLPGWLLDAADRRFSRSWLFSGLATDVVLLLRKPVDG